MLLAGRNQIELDRTQSLCSTAVKSSTIAGDITREDDCKKLVEIAVSTFGGIDHLVCNAGVSMWTRFEEIPDLAIFSQIMSVNYLGTLYCVHHALPHLKKTHGMITAIASVQALIGVPSHTGYSASKHAVRGLLESLRTELDGAVDILMAYPSWLSGTNLRENAFADHGGQIGESKRTHSREAVPADVCARMIIEAMQQRKRQIIIPRKLRILPWLNAISPRLLQKLITTKLNKQNQD